MLQLYVYLSTARTVSVHLPLRSQLHKQDTFSDEKQSGCRDSFYRTLHISFARTVRRRQLTVHTLDNHLLLKVLLTTRTFQQFLIISLVP
jgi:hypothetical protein